MSLRTTCSTSGCPVGAEVSLYNVFSGVGGLVKTPIATVSTDSNGNFTATFNWCSWRFCWWPCAPIWWQCWPWWWELDILAVIENLEQRLRKGPGGPVEFSSVAPLRQPNAADLMTGVGFAAARPGMALQPDSGRTALISAKLSNPAIREIFHGGGGAATTPTSSSARHRVRPSFWTRIRTSARGGVSLAASRSH